MNTTTKRPSDKQLGLIATLAVERGLTAQQAADAAFETSGFDLNTLTGGRPGTASKLITYLFRLPRADGQDTTPRRFTPEAGFYRRGDDVVEVRISKAGNWWAQLAVKVPGRKSLKWEYVGHRIDLSTADRLSAAEAGKFYGFCMLCGALLTDPDSIERGIGPICMQKV